MFTPLNPILGQQATYRQSDSVVSIFKSTDTRILLTNDTHFL